MKQYRITSKNSIEHVYAQRPEHSENLAQEYSDDFGNLGLLSVGQNSSYSHQEVGKKKIDFYAKPTYDSLKLAKVYSTVKDNNWGKDGIIKHCEEMMNLLKEHYEDVVYS